MQIKTTGLHKLDSWSMLLEICYLGEAWPWTMESMAFFAILRRLKRGIHKSEIYQSIIQQLRTIESEE
ncbi:hypothetical protein MHB77_25060 [Paenibacillus sp. FSL K6-3166]|uniref:hypothetical protein n=1 Tax=Paenibacillus sp. FSL K6-3166 TaxID=2921492 RepID=UPI0030F78BA1